MALKKTVIRQDLSEGNYWRLVSVNLPSIDKDLGIGQNGSLGFNIYKSEEAAKELGAGIFDTRTIQVLASFFSGWELPNTFDSVASAILGN